MVIQDDPEPEKKDASLDDDAIVVEAEAPLTLGDTVENLKAAIAGEHYENSEMYPEFAKVAKEEGLDDVAQRLNSIGRAEIHHEERYIQVLKEIEAGTFFKKKMKKSPGPVLNADIQSLQNNHQKNVPPVTTPQNTS